MRVSPEPVRGSGVVAALTINYHEWIKGYLPPYAVAIVELDDQAGLRLTTNVVGSAVEDTYIGMRVHVVFQQYGRIWLPLFAPTEI